MSKLKLSSNASGSGNVTLTSPNTNSDFTVTMPTGTGAMPLMKLETAVTASGTSVDFTGIPSWVKRITVMFDGVSTNGSSPVQIQLGDSGGIENTGYAGFVPPNGLMSAGFQVYVTWNSAIVLEGLTTITNISANNWVAVNSLSFSNTAAGAFGAGSKTLSDTLDRIRITTVNGTDTFDAGSINILLEG